MSEFAPESDPVSPLVRYWAEAHVVAVRRHGPSESYRYTTGQAGQSLLRALEQAADEIEASAIIDQFIAPSESTAPLRSQPPHERPTVHP